MKIFPAKSFDIPDILKIEHAAFIPAIQEKQATFEERLRVFPEGFLLLSDNSPKTVLENGKPLTAGYFTSEILIIADENANPIHIAADMLAQAEHDKLASSVLITTSENIASKVKEKLYKQLKNLSRKEIAEESIKNNGKIIITKNIEEAIFISNELAPEHLEINIKEPFSILSKIKNAGSIFLGANTPEALGDYLSGTNHVLPTSGTAKFSSPLSVDDFIKKSYITYYTKEALKKVKDNVINFAENEKLEAHANSVRVRF